MKWQIRPGLGFGSYATACKTIQGYEVMNMIRKGQMEGIEKGNIKAQNHFSAGLFGLVALAQNGRFVPPWLLNNQIEILQQSLIRRLFRMREET